MLNPTPTTLRDGLNRRPWQFGLRELFGLTTLAACATALAVACGAGTLMTSGGLLLAWLNWRGAFRPWQSGRRQGRLLWVGWVSFLLSLALPAARAWGTVYGAQAAWFAIQVLWGAIIRNPEWRVNLPWFAAYCAIDLANGILLVLPLLYWRVAHGKGQWMSAVLCIAMVSAWFVAWDGGGLVGYYVWCGSFCLVLVALPVRGWTLVGMASLAAVLGVAQEWERIASVWR